MTTVNRRSIAALLVGLGLLGLLSACDAKNVVAQEFERDSLVVETAGGESHRFQVELALTDLQHAQGLMYREYMPADAGMLFVERYERRWRMWMANTYIPLDMLFIDRHGKIIHIAERTVPLSRDTIPSRGKAKAVLELNAGTTERLGIAVGDRVRHESFEAEN